MRIPGIRGLLLLLCIAIVSCEKTTSDPIVALGDVNVPSLVCLNAKAGLSSAGVSITVRVNVEGTLSMSKVCWVGIFEDLAYGDEVGRYIDGDNRVFQQSSDFSFNFNLADGNYAVVIGITDYLSDAYVISAASQKQGPTRMAIGGSGCTNPPKLATIEYDCMSGYDIRGPADTLNNDNIYKYARKRFDQGTTLLAFQEDELSIAAQDFSRFSQLEAFIRDHWEDAFWQGQKQADFYLASIKNCVNRAHFFGDSLKDSLSSSASGLSMNYRSQPFAVRGASSTVFKEDLDSRLNTGYRQTGYNRTAVHEMGHALAGLKHPGTCPNCHKGGTDANCVMNEMEYNQYGDLLAGRNKFCDRCQDTIRSITW